jgi:hypothetical protein
MPTQVAIRKDVEPVAQSFYPQCYLYQQKEVDFERNRIAIGMAFFCSGVSQETAYSASKVIASIVPGFIVSRAEYEAIQQLLRELAV